MRNILFTILFFVASTVAMANNTDPGANYSIKGKVTDENGEGLAGVEVLVEGTDKKVYTDFEGNFEVPHLKNGSYTLQFTYVSFTEAKSVFKTIQNNTPESVVKLKKKKLKFN
jgi:hypothetical protein